MADQATATGTTDAGKVTETLNAEQLHDAAITAVDAYEKEQDTTKKAELLKTAKESVSKAKESYKAEKASIDKALGEATAKGKPPEKYVLKSPEKSPLKPELLDEIAAYAKAQGLSQEQAQALVERESNKDVSYKAGLVAELKTKSEGWLEEIRNDKEIGGEAFNENAELATRFVDTFGDPELKKLLTDYGFARYPSLHRMFVRAGKAMGDDKLVVSTVTRSEEKVNAADLLYPTTAEKT